MDYIGVMSAIVVLKKAKFVGMAKCFFSYINYEFVTFSLHICELFFHSFFLRDCLYSINFPLWVLTVWSEVNSCARCCLINFFLSLSFFSILTWCYRDCYADDSHSAETWRAVQRSHDDQLDFRHLMRREAHRWTFRVYKEIVWQWMIES